MKYKTEAFKKLINILQNEKTVLMDGGVGTEIQRRGVETPLPLWSAKALIVKPDIVFQIHKDYIAAGARIIKSNTFRTNRRTLEKADLGDMAFKLTELAVDLAKKAALSSSQEIYIGGSSAPLEDCYSHELVPSEKELIKEHTEHIDNLARAGVDFIAIETINNISEAKCSLKSALDVGIPAWISFVCNGNGELLSGEKITQAVKEVLPFEPFAILINCTPPENSLAYLQILRKETNLPIGLYPNGMGKPNEKHGWEFKKDDISIAKFAGFLPGWHGAGAQLIGSCCGATPKYTKALYREMLALSA